MESRPIDVAMCIDERMLGPASVALHSISVHAKPTRQIRIHVVTAGTSDFASNLQTAWLQPFFHVKTYRVDNPYAGFPENAYISPATYLRFLLPELLAIDKVLYLDADIIATRDLEALFDTELGPHSVGAVPDFAMSLGSPYQDGFKLFYNGRDHSFASYVSKVVGLRVGPHDPYFNAGVMLIDLAKWRAHGFVAQTVEFLSRHQGLSFLDQDGLNSVCAGEYRRLDARWNSVVAATENKPTRWRHRLSTKSRRWGDICAAWLRDPWIIHFAGATKPWSSGGPHMPMDDIWWSYAKDSPAASMFADPLAHRSSR